VNLSPELKQEILELLKGPNFSRNRFEFSHETFLGHREEEMLVEQGTGHFLQLTKTSETWILKSHSDRGTQEKLFSSQEQLLKEVSLWAIRFRKATILSKIEVRGVRLHNIRGFQNFHWQGRLKGEPLLLIGPNGTGKSTFLRCLALALLPRALAQSLLSSPLCRLLRDPDQPGRIEVEAGNGNHHYSFLSKIIAGRDGTELLEKHSAEEAPLHCPVYGFGAGRALDGSVNTPEDPMLRRVSTLFHYQSPLVDPETFFLRLEHYYSSHLQAVQESIRVLLDLDSNFKIGLSKRFGVEVSHLGQTIPLSSWADGYRLTLQWFIDFWNSVLENFPPEPQTRPTGILLLDELELHMHPKLQSRLLQRLRKALPDMHCILTTHSPLVALSAKSEQLLHLRSRDGDILQVPLPDIRGFSLEDVFTDPELFDVSAYDPETEAKLERWRELSRTPLQKRTPEEQSEMKTLARWLASA
jgi:DNA polymerase III delta prime subunit